MAQTRHHDLKEMLESRLRAVENEVQRRVRGAEEEIEFALVQIHAQTKENIKSALLRLDGGDYGICDDCGEEIQEGRLKALPFASRCLDCQASTEQRARKSRQIDRGTGLFGPRPDGFRV